MTKTDPPVLLACSAMATRFELVLHGDDPGRLRAAGEEALEEIRRIADRLSYFRPTSDVGRLNAGAADRPVRVSGETLALLRRAKELAHESDGAFDVTIAPLMEYWGFRGEPDRGADLRDVRGCVGMELVELNERESTVSFRHSGVRLDLGAIGKGHALDEATRALREAGVENALLHGGTSSVRAIGCAPDAGGWKVAIDFPDPDRAGERCPLAVVTLRDRSLSVSSPRGRTSSNGSRSYGHVIDPRSGAPVDATHLAAVVAESATDADALSTALLTLGFEGSGSLASRRPDLDLLLALIESDGRCTVMQRGMEIGPDARLAVTTL